MCLGTIKVLPSSKYQFNFITREINELYIFIANLGLYAHAFVVAPNWEFQIKRFELCLHWAILD